MTYEVEIEFNHFFLKFNEDVFKFFNLILQTDCLVVTKTLGMFKSLLLKLKLVEDVAS